MLIFTYFVGKKACMTQCRSCMPPFFQRCAASSAQVLSLLFVHCANSNGFLSTQDENRNLCADHDNRSCTEQCDYDHGCDCGVKQTVEYLRCYFVRASYQAECSTSGDRAHGSTSGTKHQRDNQCAERNTCASAGIMDIISG